MVQLTATICPLGVCTRNSLYMKHIPHSSPLPSFNCPFLYPQVSAQMSLPQGSPSWCFPGSFCNMLWTCNDSLIPAFLPDYKLREGSDHVCLPHTAVPAPATGLPHRACSVKARWVNTCLCEWVDKAPYQPAVWPWVILSPSDISFYICKRS